MFRCYFSYALFTLVSLFFLVISFDWRTGNGEYTLLPNGHCAFVDQYSYTTLYVAEIPTAINKVMQISMFIAYIVYYVKFNLKIAVAGPPYNTTDIFSTLLSLWEQPLVLLTLFSYFSYLTRSLWMQSLESVVLLYW